MKNFFKYSYQFFIILMILSGLESSAQVSLLPLSFSQTDNNNPVSTFTLQRLDYEAAAIEDATTTDMRYRIGIGVFDNTDLIKSGAYTLLPSGQVIVLSKFVLPDAKGIDVYFQNFQLPEGVTLFVYNANKKQIVAYDHFNNDESRKFATEIIQGQEMYLEVNAPSIELIEKTDIVLEKLIGNYRGGLVKSIEQQYGQYENEILASDPCQINANCPQGDGYRDVQKTAVHLNYSTGTGGYVCSGNMINNTAGDCKPYLLTASHCEGTQGMNDATFANWKFVFDYQTTTCTGLLETPRKTLTGAYFKSRSPYTASGSSLVLNGDFLLLEIKDPTNQLGTNIKPYLGGWDRKSTTSLGEKLISFHHPAGDLKKVTIYKYMQANGSFNGGGTNTHWACAFEQGGSQGGSSGSNIFTMNEKRIRGTLSGGVPYPNPCDTAPERRAQYSKFDRNWLYTAGNGTSAQRLKDWLDPAGLDLQSVNTVLYQPTATGCGILSINNIQDYSDQVNVYPNPILSNQPLSININIDKIKDCIIEIIDIKGTIIRAYSYANLVNSRITIDIPTLPTGMYIVKIANDKGFTHKKLIVNN